MRSCRLWFDSMWKTIVRFVCICVLLGFSILRNSRIFFYSSLFSCFIRRKGVLNPVQWYIWQFLPQFNSSAIFGWCFGSMHLLYVFVCQVHWRCVPCKLINQSTRQLQICRNQRNCLLLSAFTFENHQMSKQNKNIVYFIQLAWLISSMII